MAPSSFDYYTVVAGDTLWGIATRRGISLGMLVAANPQLVDPGRIRAGDLVRVPVLLDLGTLGGAEVRAGAINARGEIVGTSHLGSLNVYHAFRWQDGVMRDLGTLGGIRSQAVDVNDRGQIVGTATASADESAPWRAVLWQDGTAVDLGSLGGPASMAHAINNLGQIVGLTTAANGNGRGFIWQGGVMRDLGTLGGTVATVPLAINDHGQVVGATSTAGGAQHAFLWQAGSMTDLGTLGGAWSEAQDVNDRGQVVGVSPLVGDSYETWHAFLWEDGTMRDLGTLGGTWSQALAINDRGQVVGSSTSADGVKHPFLWEDGVMTDLGMLQGCRGEGVAVDINDRGQIVGTCLLQFGEHAFLNLAHTQPLPPAITLLTPAPDAAIAQNDATTGCPSNPTRGSGLRMRFEWAASGVPDGAGYELVLQHAGSLNPALDVTVDEPGYTWTSCNSFVTDCNLDGWHWQVTARDGSGRELAVSEWRSIGFLPCRLADGLTACYAPG